MMRYGIISMRWASASCGSVSGSGDLFIQLCSTWQDFNWHSVTCCFTFIGTLVLHWNTDGIELCMKISSSSSRRQICKAHLHTKVSQTRLLPYAHSNSQLLRLRLNCCPCARTTNVRGKTLPSWGSGNAEAAAADASCLCAGDDKVAVISRPQSWSCRHRVHTSRMYFGHRPWWQSNVVWRVSTTTKWVVLLHVTVMCCKTSEYCLQLTNPQLTDCLSAWSGWTAWKLWDTVVATCHLKLRWTLLSTTHQLTESPSPWTTRWHHIRCLLAQSRSTATTHCE